MRWDRENTNEKDPTGRRQLTSETGQHRKGPGHRTQHPLPKAARVPLTYALLTISYSESRRTPQPTACCHILHTAGLVNKSEGPGLHHWGLLFPPQLLLPLKMGCVCVYVRAHVNAHVNAVHGIQN